MLRAFLVVGGLLRLQEAEPGIEPRHSTPGVGVKECRAGGKGGAGPAIEDCRGLTMLRAFLVVGRLLGLQEAEPGNEPNNPTPGFGVKECRAGGKGGAGHAIEDC